jgi:hypothetical protein
VLDLPDGRVRLGRREVRELHRLALARQPHPDPVEQRRAVAWARRAALLPGRVAAIAVTAALGTAALVVGAYAGAALLVVLGLPLTLVAVALAAGPMRGSLIHRVNLSALLDTVGVPAEPLEVWPGSVRERWLRHTAAGGVLMANAVAAVLARAYSVALFCVAVAALVVLWNRGSRQAPRLPVRLDEAGVRLSGVEVPVAWRGVAAVELASSADPRLLGVRWTLHDPADRGPVLWLDPRTHPPERLVLTSRAYLAATPPGAGQPTG